MKYKCPCCGFFTMPQPTPGSREICPVCYWQDDRAQFDDPNYVGGANKKCLREARHSYTLYGVSDESCLRYVRPPLAEETAGAIGNDLD